MMGYTGVDSISSLNKSGCECCDAPCMVVWSKRRADGDGGGRDSDGPGALKTPQITRLSRVHLTRYHSLAHLPSLCQMQAQPVVQQPQPVKIYNAVYSSVQVRAYVTFLTTSHHAFSRSTSVWYEVSRLCAAAPTPTSMPLKY
jgi:hypothetical protein